jgi:hypothetical protein
MQSFIEPLYKSASAIQFGWRPEPGAASYKVYVGLSATSLTLLASNISAQPSQASQDRGKVPYTAQASAVQALLGTTLDFGNSTFFFAITYVDSTGASSLLANSTIVEVPPVGITTRFMKDDPTINRHVYYFSPDLQKWVKGVGSSSGAMVTDTADFFKANITTVYTYDTTNVKTTKSYPSDATTAGSPAKLTTYTYSGSQLTKVVIQDSTV